MFTMPMAPLVINKTSGDWMWTAASVLSLRTPKLEFDPTFSNFDAPRDGEEEEGLSMMEKYVQKLLGRSFQDSALFWHYAMRHVPSDSLMCAKVVAAKGSSALKLQNSKLIFTLEDGLKAQDPNLLVQAGTDGIQMNGYAAFALGGSSSTSCLCGWGTNAAGACVVPSVICTSLPANATQGCQYVPGTESRWQMEALILDAWEQEESHPELWPCPEMDFSDSWGLVPSDASDAWIQSQVGATTFTFFRFIRS